MDTNVNLISTELEVDSTAQMYLGETAKWGKFLAILGFIMTGLIVLIALFAGVIFSSLTRGFGGSDAATIGTTFISVVYIIIAAINFFMSLYLYKFSTKMKLALASNDQAVLNESFLNLRSMFRLIGILTLIYVGFLVLALIVSLLGAMFAR